MGNPGSIPGLGRSAGEGIGYPLQYSWASLVTQLMKSEFDPLVMKIPWRRGRLLTPVFWPGEFHGLYSTWDLKESDTTERLSLCVDRILLPEVNRIQLIYKNKEIFVCR